MHSLTASMRSEEKPTFTNDGNHKYNGSKPEESQTYTIDDAIDTIGFGPFQGLIFVFCGLLWIADAMELMILSILSPAVKCQWELSSAEEAVITSVVFTGSLTGALFWGLFGDSFGRKKALLVANLTILISGVLSALQLTSNDDRIPGFPWLLICRFGVGFGASGITQVSTYYVEFLPRKKRAICSIFVSGWWAVGTMFGAALAVGVMRPGSLGWHWYLGLCATPFAISLLFFPFIPESVRIYLAQGKREKAVKVLQKIAWFNLGKLPYGSLVTYEEKISQTTYEHYGNDDKSHFEDSSMDHNEPRPVSSHTHDDEKNGHTHDDEKSSLLGSTAKQSVKASAKDEVVEKIVNMVKSLPLLFSNGMWKISIMLFIIWFGSSWLYYGNVLLTSTILRKNPHCDVSEAIINETDDDSMLFYFYDNSSTGTNESVCADLLDTGDYLKIMWTTGAELPGLLATIAIIEIVGRKLTLAFNCFMIMVGFSLLFICTNDALLTFFLFIIRAFSTGLSQTIMVYTPEVYPTEVRGIAVGVFFSTARIGAIATPYVAQVLFETSDYATIALYAGSSLVLMVMSILLPVETKGKSLK